MKVFHSSNIVYGNIVESAECRENVKDFYY